MFYKSLDKNSADSVDWSTYTSPFHVLIWISILIAIILFCLIFMLLNRRDQISSWITLHAMLCQGYPHDPGGGSSQLVFLMTFVFGLLIMFHYSAVLMSFLAIQKEQVPFTNFDAMLSSTNFRVILRPGAIQEAIFKVSVFGTGFQVIIISTCSYNSERGCNPQASLQGEISVGLWKHERPL